MVLHTFETCLRLLRIFSSILEEPGLLELMFCDVAKLNKDFKLNMNAEEKSLNLECMAKSQVVCVPCRKGIRCCLLFIVQCKSLKGLPP